MEPPKLWIALWRRVFAGLKSYRGDFEGIRTCTITLVFKGRALVFYGRPTFHQIEPAMKTDEIMALFETLEENQKAELIERLTT